MTREDWIAFFEAMNERSPSPEEIAQAQVAGEFTDEVAAAQEPAAVVRTQSSDLEIAESVASPGQPIQTCPEVPDQQSAQPVMERALDREAVAQPSDQPVAEVKTARKLKLGKKGVLGLLAGILVLVLVGGLGAWWFYGQESLDGTWQNETFAQDIKRIWKRENLRSDILVYDEVNPRFELTIANNEVTATYKANIDYGRSFDAYLNMYHKIYAGKKIPSSTYDDANDWVKSTRDSYESVNEKENGYSYDKTQEEITKVLYKGKVDPGSKTITLTWVNDKTGVSAGTSGNTVDLDDYTDLKKGDTLSYKRAGNALTINKVTYGTFKHVN